VTTTLTDFGVTSSTARLREVLVKRPGSAFGAAFDDPSAGFIGAVDLARAQKEHDTLVDTLTDLGVRVHLLEAERANDPDLVYVFDPLLIADRGAIPLRPGKSGRQGEESILEDWTQQAGIPTLGAITAPGTVEGGDTVWLRDGLFCIGRSLRTNEAGARQLAALVGGDVRVFDLPYWRGDRELIHLMSVISPVADDLAVVFMPFLPAGLFELLRSLGIRLIEVPEDEYPTLGCNVLAVAPGMVIVAEGNPLTRRALEASGCEVHAVDLGEVGGKGSGGVTCLTRPLWRRN
jgi:N-dimethylarginine dimethylaminohydrolase